MDSQLRSSDLIRAWTVLALACAQIVTAFSPRLFGFSESVVSRVTPLTHALTPAGYAFSIWSVIFASALVFAIWQVLPRNAANPLARTIGWLAAGMYAANAAWQVWVPAFGVDWASVLILGTELALGIVALGRIRDFGRPLTRTEVWVAAAPLGLLTGWVTAASFVNLSTTVIWDGARLFQPRDLPVAAALLAGMILFAGFAVNATRSWGQAAGLLWALAAIGVANVLRAPEPLMVAICAAGAAVILVARLAPRLQVRPRLHAPA